MIKLRRFMKNDFVINAEHIEMVEETPNTVVTLSNGKKFVVEETVDEVLEKVIEYKQKIIQGPKLKKL